MDPPLEGGDNHLREGGYLVPRKQLLRTSGKLLYNESSQAHNILKINKQVLNKYPQLRDKRKSFGYNMVVPETQEELLAFLNEMKRERLIPVFLFFENMPVK